MKQHYIHTNTIWSLERRNTLSLGYCFSSIKVDAQGKPANIKTRDIDLG
jgi:hypothetical protein